MSKTTRDRQRKESQEREVLEKNLRDQPIRQSTNDVSHRGAVFRPRHLTKFA